MTAAVVASHLGSAVRGVILADPTFISPEWQREVYESDIVDQHRCALSSDRSELLAQSRLRHPDRSPEIMELITDARLQTHIQALDVLTPPNPDYRDLVRNVRAPTLLVLGSKGVVSLETARELQNINPCLRYEMIADVGHALPYDQSERLVALVRSFSRSLIAP